MLTISDDAAMHAALLEAQNAAREGEVPIGAVLVSSDTTLAAAFNRPIGSCDPTAHAEVLVLRQAATALRNYRLAGTTLYVTVEPCLMCVGALLNARVSTLVYGADEPKFGGVRSLVDLTAIRANHRLEVVSGVLEPECRELLVRFFKSRRDLR